MTEWQGFPDGVYEMMNKQDRLQVLYSMTYVVTTMFCVVVIALLVLLMGVK